MRTTRLAFNDLQNGFDVIAQENLRSIKGGTASSTDPEWGTWNGVLYTRTPGGEWEYFATLPEVVCRPTPPSGYNPSTAFVLGSNPFGFGSGDNYSNGGNENNSGGSSNPNILPSNGVINIGPDLFRDTVLIENLGLIYGAAGSIWSISGTYGMTQNLNNSTLLIDLSITNPLSFNNPSITGNVSIYDSNNNLVYSHSLSDPRLPGVNYYTGQGTTPLGTSISLPSSLNGIYTVTIEVGAYNDTGAGYQGNNKSHSFNVSIGSTWEE